LIACQGVITAGEWHTYGDVATRKANSIAFHDRRQNAGLFGRRPAGLAHEANEWFELFWSQAIDAFCGISLAPFRASVNNARMAELTTIAEPSAGRQCTDDSTAPPPALPLFQFGLRHLFWFVTAVSLLSAAATAVSPGVAPLILLTAALIITAHVTGTALGNRLRAHADRVREWEGLHRSSRTRSSDEAERNGDLAAARLPPPPPWYHRSSSALRWLSMLVAIGAIVGGTGGALFLEITIGHRTSPLGIGVGSISLAVIGGWFAFAGGSFYTIFRQGICDAMAHQANDESQFTIRR
jgi:hypothetical protein